jgi:O-antigen ligase
MIMLQDIKVRERAINWGWSLLACYPIVDYVLRHAPILRSTPIGSLWDKLIFLVLGYFALASVLQGNKASQFPFAKAVGLLMLLGAGYIVMDMSEFSIAFEGWRAVFLYMITIFLAPFFIDGKFAAKLLKISLWVSTLIALHAIYQWVTKAPMLSSEWVDASETSIRTRAYSVFGSPNILGAYFVLMFPIAFGCALTKSYSKLARLTYAGMSLLIALGLFMTYTRGSWVSLFLALLVIAALMDKRIFIVMIIGAIAVSFVPQVHARIAQLLTPLYWKKAALNGRIARSLAAYDEVRGNPLFGAGLGHYGGAVAARHFDVTYSDNYYAKTMAEMGLVGLISFLSVIMKVIRDLYKHVWKLNQWKRGRFLEAGMFAGILGIVFQNAVENIFEVPAMNFLFWFMLSLTFIIAKNGTASVQGKEADQDANQAEA